MRKVYISGYIKNEKDKYIPLDSGGFEMGVVDVGYFHGFFADCIEFETGAGNHTVAIVEKKDGTINKISPELLTFETPYREAEK